MRNHFIGALLLAGLFAGGTARAAGHLVGPGTISTGFRETSAALTADGRTLYFTRSDYAEDDDTIMVSQRRHGHWTSPQVASFSGRWHDSEPTLSPDGHRLYFVSNRPPQPGGAPVTAQMDGHRFTGTNLWYVQRDGQGHWGRPVHVDGALNDGAMIYNPSVARNGDIYFSAHRPGSGRLYQIFVVHPEGHGYGPPQRVPLGDVARNRMDPAVDPDERFLIYAGNEGDSLGSADLYIVFRRADGSWSRPVHLGDGINSRALENAPELGPHFGQLFVSSNRRPRVHFPKPRQDAAALRRSLSSPLNGDRNVWQFDISALLRSHGIRPATGT